VVKTIVGGGVGLFSCESDRIFLAARKFWRVPPLPTIAGTYLSPITIRITTTGRQAVEFLRKGPSVMVNLALLPLGIVYATSGAIKMSSAEASVVLPGDTIDPSHIPSHPKKALQLGPGLRHVPPSTILPTVAGQLVTDRRKNSLWVEYNGGRVSIQSAVSKLRWLTVGDL
jgi:hypothetical protein